MDQGRKPHLVRLVSSYATFPRLVRLLVCLAFAGRVVLGAQTAEPEANLPGIFDLAGFRQAVENGSLDKSPRNVAFEFTALYYDHDWNLLWAKGEDGDITYIPLGASPMPFVSGDRLSISGKTMPSREFDFSELAFTIVSEDTYPKPVSLNEEPNFATNEKSQWVSVDAYVDGQRETDGEHVAFELVLKNRRIKCYVLVDMDAPVLQLEGSFAKFEGLLVATPGHGTKASGMTLWTPGIRFVQESNPPLATLFEKSATPLAKLNEHSSRKGVRVEGIVYQHEQGNRLIMRDHTGQIEIRTQQRRSLKPGAFIEIVGYPTLQGAAWTLAEAIYRPADIAANASTEDPASDLYLVEQVLRLNSEQASQNRPVKLAGVITFADPDRRYLYINDGTGGIRVMLNETRARSIPVGNSITLEGITENGAFAPILQARQIKIAGSLAMPVPKQVSYEQAMIGTEEGLWVEMQGHFRYATTEGIWTILNLASSTGEFTLRMPTSRNALSINAGSILSARGVCVAQTNAKRQLVGVDLFVPNMEYIKVKSAAPKNPFETPVSTISSIRRYSSLHMTERQTQVNGVVLHHVPGRSLYLSDGENVLHVLSRLTEQLIPGDRIDVVGFLGRIGTHFVLRDGIYRKTGHETEPEAIAISTDFSANADLQGHIVNLKGRLFDIVVGEDQTRIVLQGPHSMIEAILENELGSIDPSSLKNGSILGVEGIYNIEYDAYRQAHEVSIILRDPQDLVVLATPGWWSIEHALLVAGICGGAVVFGLFWTSTLRQRVARQTALIQSQVEKQAFLIEQNKQVLDGASDFIYTLDLDGCFTSFNPAGERLTGYSPEEAISMPIYNLLDRRDKILVRLALTRLQTKAEERNLESKIIRKDGQRVWVETSVRFVRVNGKPTGVLCIMRDITTHKSIEEELKRARDAAEANTKAKDAFFATMSHELRTPMNGVIGMTNILLDTPLNEEQRDYADTIRDSSESLLVLLNDILDLSKAEAGKLTIEPHDLDLKEIVEQSMALLQAVADGKSIDLKTTIADDIPNFLIGDAGRLRQVLINLAGNAVKFTEQGGVSIGVSKLSEVNSDIMLRFEVSDTGIGVSEEAKSRLFNPFEQADGSHSRRFGGTGLGLAISKQIVELMGGEIGVDSVAGEGSTFWFNIHLAKPSQAERDAVSKATKKPTVEKWDGPAYKILIAEDMPVNQRVTLLQLKKLGFEADLVKNGLEVLEAVQSQRYDVIFMDCQMPEMDGFEATQKLRENPEYADIYIVALTANAMEGDRKRCFDVGMDDFVSKPTRSDTLRAAFERYAEKTA